MKYFPGGLKENQKFLQDKVSFNSLYEYRPKCILFNVQTSGGLLMAVPPSKVKKLKDHLSHSGKIKPAVIGQIIDRQEN